MKQIILIFIIFFSSVLLAADQPDQEHQELIKLQESQYRIHDQWFGKDKAHHFIVSAFLAGYGYYAAKQEFNWTTKQSQGFSMSFSLSFGVFKEILDGKSPHNYFSYKDLVADIAGIGVGVLVLSVN